VFIILCHNYGILFYVTEKWKVLYIWRFVYQLQDIDNFLA